MDVETAHGAEGKTLFERALAVLVGVTAVAAALLASLEVDSSKREERALLLASRLSVQISEEVSVSGLMSTFQLGSLRRSIVPGFLSIGRAQAALDDPTIAAPEAAIAAAETATQERLSAVAESMAELPDRSDGLDPHTLAVMDRIRILYEATLEELEELRRNPQPFVAEQNRQVDLAERFSARGSRTVFGLSLLAIGAVLFGLAGVTGPDRTGRVALFAAAGAILLAILWGGSALLV